MELFPTAKFKFNIKEALKSGFYVSGTTGCGKSDIAMRCVDKLRKKGVICIIFDPSQDWVARYPADQFVKPNTLSGKPFLAEVRLVGTTVVDISTLTLTQTKTLVENFCENIFLQQAMRMPEKRNFYFVIFEEAQTEFPQGILSAKRMQNAVRLLTQGRNFKIRMGVITQFAAMLDKNALRFQNQRYYGRTVEPNDVDFISAMIGDEQAESLRYFKSGEFLYSCPVLGVAEKIKIRPYKAKVNKFAETKTNI